ncbi:MAG TPA: ATP-binding protein [Chloroflexota bacterium]|nr:ATP-binding protein [Chloroflexota bacterium]
MTAVAGPPRLPARLEAGGLLRRVQGLLVFDGLRRTAPLRELEAVLTALASPPGAAPGAAEAYGALFRSLAGGGKTLGPALAEALLLDENVLSRAAAGGAPAPALLAAARADLRTLQALVDAGQQLPAAVAEACGLPEAPPWWGAGAAGGAGGAGDEATRGAAGPPGLAPNGATGTVPDPDRLAGAGAAFATRLAQADDWGALSAELAEHYASHGSGLLARYRAFRWVGPAEGSQAPGAGGAALGPQPPVLGPASGLVPVPYPDAVRPSDLIGYVEERALLWRNTVHFLAGYAANNVLLYGDRGTGKSSSVKALLNAGADRPPPQATGGRGEPHEPPVDWSALRLVEVPKSRLGDIPALMALLRGRPQRFILFVDDLSFEEGETQYKDVKAMLEGGLEARPANVVVYATSNRRHLVREQFADRAGPGSDEVHAQDTVQEKLSFADRFGITITFPTPDQASYLAIVEGLARQRGLPLAASALRTRAVEWAAWHNGRSGRTARQFVDYLAAELGLGAAPPGR